MKTQDHQTLQGAGVPSAASEDAPRAIWQPIETAPKDGSEVIVAEWDDMDGRWRFMQTYWRKYMTGYGEGFGWIGHKPTHWSPQPPLAKGESPATGRDDGCEAAEGTIASNGPDEQEQSAALSGSPIQDQSGGGME